MSPQKKTPNTGNKRRSDTVKRAGGAKKRGSSSWRKDDAHSRPDQADPDETTSSMRRAPRGGGSPSDSRSYPRSGTPERDGSRQQRSSSGQAGSRRRPTTDDSSAAGHGRPNRGAASSGSGSARRSGAPRGGRQERPGSSRQWPGSDSERRPRRGHNRSGNGRYDAEPNTDENRGESRRRDSHHRGRPPVSGQGRTNRQRPTSGNNSSGQRGSDGAPRSWQRRERPDQRANQDDRYGRGQKDTGQKNRNRSEANRSSYKRPSYDETSERVRRDPQRSPGDTRGADQNRRPGYQRRSQDRDRYNNSGRTNPVRPERDGNSDRSARRDQTSPRSRSPFGAPDGRQAGGDSRERRPGRASTGHPRNNQHSSDDRRRDDREFTASSAQHPPIDPEVTGLELDREVYDTVQHALPPHTATRVAQHLVMATQLLGEGQPESLQRAWEHAQAARESAPRLVPVRETAALVAYQTQQYGVALAELRTVRRMTGAADYLPLMADCERGLGRPERALDLAADPQIRTLPPAEQIEMLIVAAGARRDLGDAEAAIVTLQVAALTASPVRPWITRLRLAYAEALQHVGRIAEAEQWRTRAYRDDPEAEFMDEPAAFVIEADDEPREIDDVINLAHTMASDD